MNRIYNILVIGFLVLTSKAQTYSSTTIITSLKYPVAFDVATDGRIFITEKGDGSNTPTQQSRIQLYNGASVLIGTFYNLSDSTNSDGERGVLGIAMDPDFSNNHYVYAYYNHLYNGDERIRIVRFTEVANVGTNPTLIFDLDVANNIPGNHVGGNLHFRPSEPDKIYFTLGDLGTNQTNATLNYANKITNPYGKILRINKNGTIPTDNPFYDDGNPLTTNCDWIWSYGHRNPFDFCFSPVNDSLYCSENGLSSWDEANIISKGGFYGWADCEGYYVNSSTTILCNTTNAIDPIVTWGSPLPAVTGIMVYSGTVWNALDNHLLVADNDNGFVYDCTLGNPPAYNTVTNKVQLGDLTGSGGLTTLKQSYDGCIYALKGGYTTTGAIYKVCPLNTGIEQLANEVSLFIYPNPAQQLIHLDINLSESKIIKTEIIDLSGRILLHETYKTVSGKNTMTLDFKNNTSGMYFIQLKDAGTNQIINTSKIIVE